VIFQKIKDIDMVFLQETHFKNHTSAEPFNQTVKNIFKIFHSYATVENQKTGVSILINRALPITDLVFTSLIQGRLARAEMVLFGLSVTCFCVYAPSNPQERPAFFTETYNIINASPWYNATGVLLLGDFNMVENPDLDRSRATGDRQSGLRELLQLKSLLSLYDIYREKNPGKKDFFTFLSDIHGSQARLDRVYATLNLIPNSLVTGRSVNLTDHRLVRVRFQIDQAAFARGPGFFKINTMLLEESGVTGFIERRLDFLLTLGNNLPEQWEAFKLELKLFFKKLGKDLARERNINRKTLEERIQNVSDLVGSNPNSFDLKNHLKSLKNELELLNHFYISKCKHSCYFKDFVDDKITLSTVKSQQRREWNQRHIYAIKRPDGSLAEGSASILQELKTQYEHVFKTEPISEEILRAFLEQENLPRLTECQKNMMDSEITLQEIKHAVHACQGRKTPGLDGLPIEVYWACCDKFASVLFNLYNCNSLRGEMHQSAYEGLISLLYKGKGERCIRENWRPLTLLNLDYKILAKIYARRIEKVMTALVHPDQTCSVPGRTILDSILHVMTTIQYCDITDTPALIMSVDHAAAFDMIEWRFIFETFKSFNFGDSFLSVLQQMYNPMHTSSNLIVNGYISEKFPVTRGVRQGCPLSPYIYVITSEVLAHYIRRTNSITGIPMAGVNNRLTKYADDTSIFLTKWEEVLATERNFQLFQRASGSRLKTAKTQILPIGPLKAAPTPPEYRKYVVGKLKLYGIMFDAYGVEKVENWGKCSDTINSLSTNVPPYGISIFGRMHTLSIFFLCFFNYLLRVESPPAELVRRTYNAATDFLWFPSKRKSLKREILRLPPSDGGVGFPDIAVRTAVNRLHVLIHVLSHKENLSWVRAFLHLYRRVENSCKAALNQTGAPDFFKDIRRAVIDTGFRRQGDFCWFFGKKFYMQTVKTKTLYDHWIKQKYKIHMNPANTFWSNQLGPSVPFVEKSWEWAKAKYVDGNARTIHFKLRHKALLTNHIATNFVDVPPTCKLCEQQGMLTREDNAHLMIYCTRAYNLDYFLTPILQRIAETDTIPSSADLILGINLHNKRRQTLYNFIVQHSQLAKWQSRTNLNMDHGDTDAESLFRRNVFRNLCRVRITMGLIKFREYFREIIFVSPTPLGFSLRL
jgi:hypothetical protein